MKWYTAPDPEDANETNRLLGAWPEAPIENLEVLGMILDAARDQVLAYAPAPAPLGIDEPTPPPPSRYVLAQLRQAQTLWDAGRVSSSGDIGDGSFLFTPRPMDKTIRGIIRPPDVKPHAL